MEKANRWAGISSLHPGDINSIHGGTWWNGGPEKKPSAKTKFADQGFSSPGGEEGEENKTARPAQVRGKIQRSEKKVVGSQDAFRGQEERKRENGAKKQKKKKGEWGKACKYPLAKNGRRPGFSNRSKGKKGTGRIHADWGAIYGRGKKGGMSVTAEVGEEVGKKREGGEGTNAKKKKREARPQHLLGKPGPTKLGDRRVSSLLGDFTDGGRGRKTAAGKKMIQKQWEETKRNSPQGAGGPHRTLVTERKRRIPKREGPKKEGPGRAEGANVHKGGLADG